MAIDGLHHVTVVGGAPQRNLDFYTGPLAQHLVKLTVNFDDPGMYHLYYGDEAGRAGTIMTYFPIPCARRGRAGAGAACSVAYALADPEGAAGALAEAGVDISRATRFSAPVWQLHDPDGLALELVKGTDDAAGAFHSVTLWLHEPGPTARLLTEVFGYEMQGETREDGGTRQRLALPGTPRAGIIDLWHADTLVAAQPGAGAVHHIAFRARDRAHQDALSAELRARGLQITPRQDRNYFESVYFREPGGVLFEIATDPPGFTTDEPAGALGRALKLPTQFEPMRDRIEAALPPLTLPT